MNDDLLLMLDVWQALGLPPNDFHGWIDGEKVTLADAWAQLVGAVAGNADSLASDTNPPAPSALIKVAIEREHAKASIVEQDQIGRLRAAIDSLLADIDTDHTKAADAPWCRTCGPSDGSWPCVHRMALDELKEARHE